MQKPRSTPNSPTVARTALIASIAVFLFAVLCGCGTSRVSHQRQLSAAPTARPTIIYVTDFQLDPAIIEWTAGLLPAPPNLPGPVAEILPLPGARKKPEIRAQHLVETMGTALTQEINKVGYNACRLKGVAVAPGSGWQVRGVFTRVSEGNQMQRALIGFGAGKTDLEVVVAIDDLALGPPRPMHEITAEASSGKAPGAGPALALGPAGPAVRIVIASKDLDRNVRQTASKICEAVHKHAQAAAYSTATTETHQ